MADYKDLLLSPTDWLAMIRVYNAKYWGGYFHERDLNDAEAQLALVPVNHEQDIVHLYGFHVAFQTLAETVSMWFKVYRGELPNAQIWEDLRLEDEYFGLHAVGRTYEPGIHLLNVDLVAHWQPRASRSLVEVRERAYSSGETLAQLEVISVYGVLTKLLMQQGGNRLPFTDMPATVVTIPDKSQEYALCLLWNNHDRTARLRAGSVEGSYSFWAAPVIKDLPQ